MNRYSLEEKVAIVKMARLTKESLSRPALMGLGLGGIGLVGLGAKALQPYGTIAEYTDIYADPQKGKGYPIYARSEIKRPLIFRKKFKKLTEKPKQYAVGMGTNPRQTFEAMLHGHATLDQNSRFRPDFTLHQKDWIERAISDKYFTKKDNGEPVTDKKLLRKFYLAILGKK